MTNNTYPFFSEEALPFAVTATDKNLKIIYMNEKARKTFLSYGGGDLIGEDLMNCHNQNSRDIIERLINKGDTNSYTIEKGPIKKIIHQTPWYQNGEIAGLMEVSIEIPLNMPHFVRETK